ncbi:DUF6294 family protein [Streptomyces sp. NPDC049577]|uniref:DUF6294 family protein n=1 Tax=Streptomyces sp. NPDC049577 TaxID=3155153 RepID=UPI00342B08A2
MRPLRQAARILITAVAVFATMFTLNAPAWAAPDVDVAPATSGVAADYKWYSWGDLSVGDCHQTGGMLKIYPDGKFTFSATTWTTFTLSGDIWWARFDLRDGANNSLFTTASVRNPEAMWPSKHHDWTANGTYPAEFYNAVAHVIQRASC